MTASQSLLPPTIGVEASYAELKKNLDDLQRQFKLRELEEQTALQDKMKALDTEVESQRAALVAAQSDPSLRATVEKLLRDTRDLKAEALKKTYEEQKDERKKRYDEAKKKFKEEAFAAVTALAMLNVLPGSIPSTPPRHLPTPEATLKTSQSTAVSRQASPATFTSAIPPQPQEAAPYLAEQGKSTFDGRSAITQHAASGHSRTASEVELNQTSPPRSSHQAKVEDATVSAAASPAQSSVEPATTPGPAVEQPPARSGSPTPMEGVEQSFPAADRTADSDPALKRKANVESNPESPIPTQNRVKRAKLEKRPAAVDEMDEDTPKRTITFQEVYGKPSKLGRGGNPIPSAKHIIVQFPPNSRKFYILRCDEHGVHFGEHPLRGAAKHLASAQHGKMCKAHATAIAVLGHLVIDCTQELADLNNAEVLEAFQKGYRPFNANNLSQTKRAELGYPPLDSPNTQKAAAQRAGNYGTPEASPSASSAKFRIQSTGIAYPSSARFYVALGPRGEVKYPALILPLGDLTPAGVKGTLAATGIFRGFSDGGKQPGMPDLPKCYEYERVDGRIAGIRGWATGYGAGGPLVKKREFPVLYVDNADYHQWSLGWIGAGDLAELDFDSPNSQRIPFFREARDYYVNCILSYENAQREASKSSVTGTPTPLYHALGSYGSDGAQDVEMKDARANVGDTERDSNRREAREGGRTKLPSGRPTAPISSATHAQIIAAQALGLQPPARSAFTPINARPSASRSASASQEPPSRSGSVSSTSASHKRVVKIHAASNTPHPAAQSQQAPAIVLPERPAESSPPPLAPASQPSSARRSPASLQHILQNPSENSEPVQRISLSPGPLAPEETQASPKASLAPLGEPLRENRAGSAPIQRRDSPEGERQRPFTPQPALLTSINNRSTEPLTNGRAGSAPASREEPSDGKKQHTDNTSSNPIPIRLDSPIKAAPKPTEGQKQQSPPPSTTALPPNSQLGADPLTTPTTSSLNARANSPILLAPKPVAPSVAPPSTSFTTKLETLSLTPTPTLPINTTSTPAPSTNTTTPQAPSTLPTMDAFDLGGFVDGDKALFVSNAGSGSLLRLVDDHQTGVFRTANDAPVKVVVEPRKIRVVERSPAQNGAVCIVKLTYHGGGEEKSGAREGEVEDGGKGGGEERTQTLVFEKARSTASGMLNGVVHARRFCRRVQAWNPEVLFPTPEASSDSVSWRTGSQTPVPTPAPSCATSTSAAAAET